MKFVFRDQVKLDTKSDGIFEIGDKKNISMIGLIFSVKSILQPRE